MVKKPGKGGYLKSAPIVRAPRKAAPPKPKPGPTPDEPKAKAQAQPKPQPRKPTARAPAPEAQAKPPASVRIRFPSFAAPGALFVGCCLAAAIACTAVALGAGREAAPQPSAQPLRPLQELEVDVAAATPGGAADMTWQNLFDLYELEPTLQARTLERNAVNGRRPLPDEKIGRARVTLVLSGVG